ncbi:MAG TPA: hypothetical protein VGN20_00975 [Mucilaginibacter sp.]|jgi:hypothetical protein
MKKLILILSLINISFTVLGQRHTPSNATAEAAEEKAAEKNDECVHRNKYSVVQRSQFYPFSNAMQIRLVFFKNTPDFDNRLPLKNDTVDYSKLLKIKALNKDQIAKLTDIMYNVGYRAPKWAGRC